MEFVELKEKYITQIAEIERGSFDMPWTENMLRPEIGNVDSSFIVGVEKDEVICYGSYHTVLDEAHINNIAVRETCRSRGIGKLLMEELIAGARERGIKRATLEVRDGNEAAVRLYERLGFKTEGVRKKYYSNKYDALVMWLDV